jgi:transposase-like protein
MSKSKRSRRQYTTEQKVAFLREHLVDKVPASEVCTKHDLRPSVFYQWLRQAQDNLAAALTATVPEGPSKREKQLAARVAELEAKLAKKDGVIAEIAAEYTQLKKELGEP